MTSDYLKNLQAIQNRNNKKKKLFEWHPPVFTREEIQNQIKLMNKMSKSKSTTPNLGPTPDAVKILALQAEVKYWKEKNCPICHGKGYTIIGPGTETHSPIFKDCKCRKNSG